MRPCLAHSVAVLFILSASAILFGISIRAARAGEQKPNPITPEQAAFFESKVRPVLAANCFACHGEKEQRGGVRLDSRDSLLASGKGGPIVVPGALDGGRLIRAIRQSGPIKMPPNGKLRDTEIAALAEWVKMGAPWPVAKPVVNEPRSAAGSPEYVIRPDQKNFWSFRPVRRPALPTVKNAAWVRTPIDRFILAGLESKGLKPAPSADRRTLIRRATLDIIGLPPTPEEVDAFVADKSPNAWEKLIDRLLASPHYGERWGRRWLDLVRYADSNGLDENVAFAHAYLYRDYVVSALNHDKPYDEFIREQLAGDLLPTDDEAVRGERLTATGFLTLGAKVLAEPDKDKMLMDIVDEQIEVTSKAFLGLTVACARCHNHKFDPIPTKDYYALAGIFKSTKAMESLNTVAMWNERPLPNAEVEQKRKAYEPKLTEARKASETVLATARKEVLESFRKDGARYVQAVWEIEHPSEVDQGKPNRKADQLAKDEKLNSDFIAFAEQTLKNQADPRSMDAQVVNKAVETVAAEINKELDQKSERFYNPDQKRVVEQAVRKLKDAEAAQPKRTMVMAVEEGKVADCRVHVRGDTTNLGDSVPRRFLTVLCGNDQKPIDPSHSGRLELAQWLADPAHPLTGRVAVNRIWQDHFGEGLVRTPDNYGFLGLPPSHPELLDWLASTFTSAVGRSTVARRGKGVANCGLNGLDSSADYACGWSFKRLHKLIMMSNAYKMSTVGDDITTAKAGTADPENKLLWRFNRRRMEAEPFRDSMLFISGKLDLTIGGSLLKSGNHDYVTNDQSGNAAQYNAPRRSIYLPMIRNALFDMFQAFDVGDPSMVNAKRNATTVSPQALYVMNSPFVLEQSKAFAEQLLAMKGLTDAQRLDLAYRKTMARSVTPSETARMLAYINAYESRLSSTEPDSARRHLTAWASACQALFASNEFIYVN